MNFRMHCLVASTLLVLLFPAHGVTLRWASSSQRIYVTGPGSATLTDIKTALPNAPLTLVHASNRVWYLGADLFVEAGARLQLHGPAIGGDVAELRLKSDNTSETNAFVEIRADWGWLDIRHTKITSWDSAANGPDTVTTNPRAFIRARSKLDPDGVTARESRMDIIHSEICYLGSKNSEAYGLTWKVVDTTAAFLPAGSTNTLFDVVNVYGNILNSHIHHNFFGVYTYGHQGGHWATNEVDHNIRYGFDPHDDSDDLVIEHNNVHHNGWHGIIASKRCDRGIMRNNVAWSNGTDLADPHGHGIMLHRSSNDWLVEGNQSLGNADTGIAIFACDRTLIRNNLCLSNANAGIRFTVGSADNWIEGNVIGDGHRYGLYLFEGDDPPEPGEDGGPGSVRCHGNTFTNNLVRDCTSDSIKVNGADRNAFLANVFAGGELVLRFEKGTNNLVDGNALPASALVKMVGAATNFNSTTFKQQPRLSLQLDPCSTATFTDDAGAIFDSGQIAVATRVATEGSFVTLTAAQIGSGTTVVRRNLLVKLNEAEAWVSLPLWELSGQLKRRWISQPTSATAWLGFTVGDLSPHQSYAILKNDQALALVVSDANGSISFADVPRTTNAVQYAIIPTNQSPTRPTVSVTAEDLACSESGLDRGGFVVRRIGSLHSELNVRYSVGGTALNGTDFSVLPGSITIPIQEDSASVVVLPIDDADMELPETVLLTLTPDNSYDIQLESAMLNILDNDLPTAPVFLPPQMVVNNLQLRFATTPGLTYEVQYKNSLDEPVWHSLQTVKGDLTVQMVQDEMGGLPQRFYRLRVSSPFFETDGLVVMEAEHFAATNAASGRAWEIRTDRAGFVGEAAMQALPNTGASITANVTNTSPALSYQVEFTTTGTYHFWIRGWAAAGSDDSVHLGVDGQVLQSLTYSPTGAWMWRARPVSITNAGPHEINVWMREDGAYVDRLLLTTNLSFTPNGNGPPESDRP